MFVPSRLGRFAERLMEGSRIGLPGYLPDYDLSRDSRKTGFWPLLMTGDNWFRLATTPANPDLSRAFRASPGRIRCGSLQFGSDTLNGKKGVLYARP